jgi:(S)-ureidoglycine aminohydrolase
MRPHPQLVYARTRVRQRYALMPLEGYPLSKMPGWPAEAEIRVLASPALGAKFVQYLIDLPAGVAGALAADAGEERFFYVVRGEGQFVENLDEPVQLYRGSFGLVRPGSELGFRAEVPMRLMLFRKLYQAAVGIDRFQTVLGNESQVPGTPWADTDKIRLQTLIPDDMQFDMAMNIFTFTPGFGLPIVETHVMEHGLLFLQGKGVYFLDGEWMEVETDDFIWMGPYCPQSFYATGPEPAKYIYYKDVNREITI